MHMQVITFKLDGIDDVAYQAHAEQNAPMCAALPGLRAKVRCSFSATCWPPTAAKPRRRPTPP
jgi:hypothetical protein